MKVFEMKFSNIFLCIGLMFGFFMADTAKAAMTVQSVTSTENGIKIVGKTSGASNSNYAVVRRNVRDNRNRIVGREIPLNVSNGTFTFIDTGAKLGEEYCYIIRFGRLQTDSWPKCIIYDGAKKDVARPERPTKVRITELSSKSMHVEFIDNSDNEQYFFLEQLDPYYLQDPDLIRRWAIVSVLQANAGAGEKIGLDIKNLEREQRYCFRVRAVNDAGEVASGISCGKTYEKAYTFPKIAGFQYPQWPYAKLSGFVHPAINSLEYKWNHTEAGFAYLFDSENTDTPIQSKEIGHDIRFGPSTSKKSVSFKNLNPDKLYCIATSPLWIKRSECSSPFGLRSVVSNKAPSKSFLPKISSIERITPSQMGLDLINPTEGQLIQIIRVADGASRTIEYGVDGRNNIAFGGIHAGYTYCMRVQIPNEFGITVGEFKCETSLLFDPNKPYLNSEEGDHIADDEVTVNWRRARAGVGGAGPSGVIKYDVKFSGTKDNAISHNGSIGVSPRHDMVFKIKQGYSYCIKVRASDHRYTTEWSPELCNVTRRDDGSTDPDPDPESTHSYATLLAADIPSSGIILYTHLVNPGVGSSRLQKVDVAGNIFTRYRVHFLLPTSARQACGTDIGVIVEPGNDLSGEDLSKLYGSTLPSTPILLKACKLARESEVLSTDGVSIQVTYKRP